MLLNSHATTEDPKTIAVASDTQSGAKYKAVDTYTGKQTTHPNGRAGSFHFCGKPDNVANQNVNNAEAIIVIICQRFRCSIVQQFLDDLCKYIQTSQH
jgi:hypothetical protein